MVELKVKIKPYKKKWQPQFEALNRQWIEQYFHMEPIDLAVLQDPETHILSKGGEILFACRHKKVVGVAALKKVNDKTFEFTKMAVEEKLRGAGIGKALTLAALKKAHELGAEDVILYSNRILAPAIALYSQLGFEEIPIEPGVYERSDIKMKISVQP